MKHFLDKEKVKLKDMTFAEKRWYLWEYYKFHLFIGGMVLFFLGSLINHLWLNPPRDNYLYLAWSAQPVSAFQLTALADDLSLIVENPAREQVMITSYVEGLDQELNMAIRVRRMSLLSSGSLHGFITTYHELEELYDTYFLQPLSALSPYLDLSQFELAFVSGTDQPMALSLAHSPLLESLGMASADLYFALSSTSQQLYPFAKAVQHLLP